jgi:hypothetical protein
VATAGFYGAIFQTLSSFEMGRNLLLSCPEALTAGVFTKDGPSKAQLEQTSFEMHFYALGYSEPLPEPEPELEQSETRADSAGAGTTTTKGGKEILSPNEVGSTSNLSKSCEFPSFTSSASAAASSGAASGKGKRASPPDRRVHTVISGPEPGYVATPAIFVALAMSLSDQRTLMPQGGVMTPAAAWVDVPDIFDRLRAAGVGFRLVGLNWDEGIKKSTVMRERGIDDDSEAEAEEGGENNQAFEGDKARARGEALTGAVPVGGKEGLAGVAADVEPVHAHLLGRGGDAGEKK